MPKKKTDSKEPAAKKAVRKKKTAAKKKAAPKTKPAEKKQKKTAAKRKTTKRSPEVSSPCNEESYATIQTEAYLLAERDGFTKDPIHYWLEAEQRLTAA